LKSVGVADDFTIEERMRLLDRIRVGGERGRDGGGERGGGDDGERADGDGGE